MAQEVGGFLLLKPDVDFTHFGGGGLLTVPNSSSFGRNLGWGNIVHCFKGGLIGVLIFPTAFFN